MALACACAREAYAEYANTQAHASDRRHYDAPTRWGTGRREGGRKWAGVGVLEYS